MAEWMPCYTPAGVTNVITAPRFTPAISINRLRRDFSFSSYALDIVYGLWFFCNLVEEHMFQYEFILRQIDTSIIITIAPKLTYSHNGRNKKASSFTCQLNTVFS